MMQTKKHIFLKWVLLITTVISIFTGCASLNASTKIDTTEDTSSTIERYDIDTAQLDIITFKDRRYTNVDVIYPDLNFSSTTDKSNLGEKIGMVEESFNLDLVGSEIYKHTAYPSENIIIVKHNNDYMVFAFENFTTYMYDNQDKDATAYLELYNINSALDIKELKIYTYKDDMSIELINDITDQKVIEEFYQGYRMLKNSSDKYFEILNNETFSMKVGEESDYNTSSMIGSSAITLADNTKIRVCLENSIYFDLEFYPYINFISRYELSNDFASFIKSICKIKE